MPLFEWKNVKIQVDEDGFMENPEEWNKEVALALASTEDVTELTEEHWKLINYLTGFPLKKVYELFPSGPAKGACKVAGLAKPTGCV